ncbi:MAG: helix-turn-helix domain-containing protein [bacterium]|nr:helix-turn-helix domain-containing protein [bacterium]
MKSGNYSASEFADKIGVKRSNLSHVLSGRNKPSLDFLVKVINAYPKVNASWLITGEAREETPVPSKNDVTPSKEEVQEDSVNHSKEIEKILIFYQDGTFDKYTPNQQ